MKIKLTPKMEDIVEFLADFPKPVYFVGGCVRDIIMGIEPHDYDMCTSMEPEDMQRWIKSKGRKPWLQGKKFGTIGFKQEGIIVEITTYRKETYDFKTRKPNVVFSKYVQEDLGRRDFTINALICDLEGHVKDYYGGLDDIKDKVLRSVGEPKLRFKEDPLRILRGIRHACKYGFGIEEKTLEKMIHCRWELLRLSKERIREEMEKVFELPPKEMGHAMDHYFMYDIFQVLFPELHLQKDYDQQSPYHKYCLDLHTVLVMERIRKEMNSKDNLWTALFHDIGKPFVRTLNKKHTYYNYINHDVLGAAITERLLLDYKFSNESRKFIVSSIKGHIKEESWLKPYDDVSK